MNTTRSRHEQRKLRQVKRYQSLTETQLKREPRAAAQFVLFGNCHRSFESFVVSGGQHG